MTTPYACCHHLIKVATIVRPNLQSIHKEEEEEEEEGDEEEFEEEEVTV